MDVIWTDSSYEPKPEKRFEKVYDDGYAVFDNETNLLYHTDSDYVAVHLAELMNGLQAEIERLKKELEEKCP